MTIYDLLNRLFPTSFIAKVFFVSFVGTHVPLIAVVGYFLAREVPSDHMIATLTLVLIATLVGTAFSFAAMWMLLTPVRMTRNSLSLMEEGKAPPRLPERYRDDLGFLMSRTNSMARALGRRLAAAETAALYDQLTGILNRRGLMESAPHMPDGAVLFIDIDHFKRINDAHGHSVGDSVLKQVADTAASALRHGDILARFGGEEFVAWLPAISAGEASTVAERVRQSIEAEVLVDGAPVTVSLGLAVCDGDRTLDAVFEVADKALYDAKSAGRNRVCFADMLIVAQGAAVTAHPAPT
ncbi:MAG: GGDEF domain-containing protein [Silicimonas sp.]|nr:GGDEF domain-containing protein [Silicimonas sp.]